MNYKLTNYVLLIAVLFFFLFSCITTFAQFPSWSSISGGTNGPVKSIITFNGDLIVAGSFSTPGKNIAKYNGFRWDTLGRGTNDTIYTLAIYNNKLIAAGAFDSAGGVVCNNIAQWNGVAWSPLGLGTNNTIFTIDSISTFLIVGGRFTSAGGVSCSRVAKWQGTSWSALGSGVNDNVYALEWFNDNLILGGAFTMAGTDTAKRIVKYDLDSGSYSALGIGIDSNNVFALRSNLGNLYVGGDFTTIGGDSVKRFAQWNDTNWLAIGSGMNGPVRVLDSIGAGVLRIGGSFTNAGGVSANNIVAYASLSFAPYGGGLSGASVNATLTWRGITVAGGSFGTQNISRWALLPAAPELILPEDTAIGISVTPLFTWTMGPWMYSFTIQVARDPNFLNITLTDSTLLVPELQVSGSTPLQNLTLYFWRVRAANGLGNGPWSLIRYFTTGFIGIINNSEVPLKFNLYQNYPNPFNPVTKIKFDLPAISGKAELKLNIFSVTGEKVAELLNTEYAPGKWELEFDGSNFASGIYFCKIEAGPFVSTNKMILLK